MVAQLNNQDPLNPMDNAELTTQMAQINTVSGIQQLNATLTAMSTQFNNLQALQSTSLIGRQVVNGNTLSYGEDGVAKGALLVADAADSVKVEILGTSGQVIDTVDMGGLSAGQYSFEWDAGSRDHSAISAFASRPPRGRKSFPPRRCPRCAWSRWAWWTGPSAYAPRAVRPMPTATCSPSQ